MPRVPAERIFGRVLDLLERLLTLAEEDDLTVDLCVRSSPGGASVTLRPRSYPPGEEKVRRTAQRISRLPRGAYVFRVEVPEGPLRRRGYRGVDCYPRDDEPPSHCLDLDLVTRRAPLVHCDLVTRGLHGDCAVEEEPPGGTECGRD